MADEIGDGGEAGEYRGEHGDRDISGEHEVPLEWLFAQGRADPT
jgi:hypothetical protein